MLRFYARGDALVSERDADGHALPRPPRGGAARYVGRQFDAELRGYPATRDGYTCAEDGGEARYLLRVCREGDLHPADKHTADAAGVPFVDLSFGNGVWIPKAEQARGTRTAAKEPS